MTRYAAVSAVVALCAGLAGTYAYVQLAGGGNKDTFAQCRASNVAGGAGEIGGPFTLVNHNGETVTDSDVITKPSLVYFGYSFCPDVCPLDTVRNADAADLLSETGHEVRPVFISVDPGRDTPEALADFVANLHPDMVGLTGTDEQVAAAAAAYKVYFRKQPGDDEYYLIDHSTFTYLVLPDYGFVEFYRRDLSAEALADGARCFIDAANG